jgi:hypothetical protein
MPRIAGPSGTSIPGKALEARREEHRHTYKKRSYSIRVAFTWLGQ